MTEVIGVRFKKVGKVYYFDPKGIAVQKEMPVIVETARGLEYGEVTLPNTQLEDDKIVQPLKPLIRIATPADTKIVEQNEAFEQEAFRICEAKIAAHKLEMKLVTVEYTFDHSKLLFYFSADGRVDFRELVKDLAGVFRTRIELRQIGVRDEAKMIGGLGICGRPLCCSAFLKDFQPVSINMAKDQGLSLNPTKISGTCGRLMCCLKYENEAYQEMIRQTPPNESLVDTPYGRGNVLDSSLLRGTCRVRMLNNPDSPVTVPCGQCCVLRRGRDKGEPLPPEPAPAKAPLLTSLEDSTLAAEAAPEQGQPQRQKPRPPRQDRSRPRQGERSGKPADQQKQNQPPRNKDAKPGDRKPGGRSQNRPGRQAPQKQPPKEGKPREEQKPKAPENGEGAQNRSGSGAGRNRRRGGYRSGFRNGKKPENAGKPSEE